jgi:hypothetical protein
MGVPWQNQGETTGWTLGAKSIITRIPTNRFSGQSRSVRTRDQKKTRKGIQRWSIAVAVVLLLVVNFIRMSGETIGPGSTFQCKLCGETWRSKGMLTGIGDGLTGRSAPDGDPDSGVFPTAGSPGVNHSKDSTGGPRVRHRHRWKQTDGVRVIPGIPWFYHPLSAPRPPAMSEPDAGDDSVPAASLR